LQSIRPQLAIRILQELRFSELRNNPWHELKPKLRNLTTETLSTTERTDAALALNAARNGEFGIVVNSFSGLSGSHIQWFLVCIQK